MGIAGGEPLLYPHLLDVVTFIARNGMKPLLLTNGEHLTPELARELWEAGLVRFHFHVDSGQRRKGWEGKNENELNALRQQYADLVWATGGMQCGYNITVRNSSVQLLPDIVAWARRNVHKVHHLSLVAYRAIPLQDEYEFLAGGRTVDASQFQHSTAAEEEISLTSLEMLDTIREEMPDFHPSVYLQGTADPDTFKFLVTLQIGSRHGVWGYLGPKSAELIQTAHHVWTGRYVDFVRETSAGKKAYLLGLFDRHVRRAFARYCAHLLLHPWRAFARTGIQSISLQQPNEFLRGEANLCGGCPNMMIYRGELIPSCRLDEYRIFGDQLVSTRRKARVTGEHRATAHAIL
jgi:hypothetical protein